MSSEPMTHQSYSPRQTIAGAGASSGVGTLLNDWGVPDASPVALVVDPDVFALGIADPVRQGIESAGFTVIVIPCDKGEPALSWVERVVADVRAAKPAACVGVGGGSAMDVAKLAAALVTNPGQVRDFLGAGKVHAESISTVMIPTTAGTGSETTQVAMLSTGGKKVVVASAPLIPRAAVLDPALTVGLPRGVTAASGLDALAHGLEAYLSLRANPLTMGASLYGAQLVASSLSGAFEHPDDVQHRMGMLGGAYWAGIGLNANVILGHSIAYTVANRTGLPHGVTCAMALPYCLAYNEVASHDRIDRVARILRDGAEDESTSAADPTGIYGWLEQLSSMLGIPRNLSEVGVTEKDIPTMVTECIESYPRPNNPVPLDAVRLRHTYEFLLHGDVLGCVKSFSNN